ncbi:unnamed protein product [Pleuronectes platessa]|uniref:Uncharacterized protein n=1 Tax=Pleuronectes platessa TaxID=8262 RepID=A0A9N7TI56_PLEPL|nr:unnamed protein product [Pleuronectes platessa]
MSHVTRDFSFHEDIFQEQAEHEAEEETPASHHQIHQKPSEGTDTRLTASSETPLLQTWELTGRQHLMADTNPPTPFQDRESNPLLFASPPEVNLRFQGSVNLLDELGVSILLSDAPILSEQLNLCMEKQDKDKAGNNTTRREHMEKQVERDPAPPPQPEEFLSCSPLKLLSTYQVIN